MNASFLPPLAGEPLDRGDARPSAWHVGTRQLFTTSPSTSTEHAAALALAAPFLGAGETQLLAQRVEQPFIGRHVHARFFPFTLSAIVHDRILNRPPSAFTSCSPSPSLRARRRHLREDLSGVSGMASNSSPVTALIAFTIAAAARPSGHSPPPWPERSVPVRVLHQLTARRRRCRAWSDDVVGERACSPSPALHHHLFEERPAHRLQRPALDLPLDEQRVDRLPMSMPRPDRCSAPGR